jgi:hypothetical protein
MATATKTPSGTGVLEQYHVYHAEAHLLTGHIEQPVKKPIEDYGRVLIEKTRRSSLVTQNLGETTVEDLYFFKSGRTRVSGAQVHHKTDILGSDHSGWVTQSTSALEGFNAVDVLTADRIVSQVSSEHPMIDGHVPRVTFLGTRFENLRIGGFPVQVELDFNIVGPKPDGDRTYFEDLAFLERVERQMDGLVHSKGLPESLEKQYDAKITYIDELRKRAKSGTSNEDGRPGYHKLQCSLVKSIGPIPLPGVRTFGNLIFIPDFGVVCLAALEVGIEPRDDGFGHSHNGGSSQPGNSNYFQLTMLDMHLGCPTQSNSQAAKTKTNGNTQP